MGALEIYYIENEVLQDYDFTAYNKPGKLVAGATFTGYPFYPWTVDVTSSDNGELILQNIVSEGKTQCQFRIQFFTSTNWDGIADMICFDGATLRINYIVPAGG